MGRTPSSHIRDKVGHLVVERFRSDTFPFLLCRTPPATVGKKRSRQDDVKVIVAEAVTTRWASPIVSVQKKNVSLRFRVDYQKLNAITARDSYPLPRIDECIDILGSTKLFSPLDASSGYYKIRLDEANIEKSLLSHIMGCIDIHACRSSYRMPL